MSGYAAKKMASRQAKSMLAPLLSDDESSASGASDDGSNANSRMETVKRTPMQKLRSSVVYLGLGAGVALSGAAMALSPLVPIFVMGAVCIANVPFAALKERSIGKLPTLRAMSNKLKEDANILRDQVDALSDEVDVLEPEADRAAAVEDELRVIASEQRSNVDKLVELVKENEIVLAKMRENVRQMIVSDMIQLVVRSDRDNDGTIGVKESRALALQIHIALQEYHVEFDTEKFLKAIGSDSTIERVIEIVQKLMPVQKREGKKESKRSDGDGSSDDESRDGGKSSDDDRSSGDDGESNGDDSGSDWEAGSDYDSEDSDFDMFHMMEGAGGGGGGRVSLVNVDRRKARKSMARISRMSLAQRASLDAGGRRARAAPVSLRQNLARADGYRKRGSAKAIKRRSGHVIDPSELRCSEASAW